MRAHDDMLQKTPTLVWGRFESIWQYLPTPLRHNTKSAGCNVSREHNSALVAVSVVHSYNHSTMVALFVNTPLTTSQYTAPWLEDIPDRLATGLWLTNKTARNLPQNRIHAPRYFAVWRS